MSADEKWANDAEPSDGNGCWPLFALIMRGLPTLALVLTTAAVMMLAGCRTSTEAPVPLSPATGVQPQPPVTAVVPSAVRVRP